MKLSFYGAAQTVTGSRHLLEVNGMKILLDCGLYQGRQEEEQERNRVFPFDCKEIDALVLSHAHIDHSGNIPNLVRNGFTGDIICTYATRDLCAVMLRDSAKIQKYDAEYLNRKRKRQGLEPIDPLYTMEDAVQSMNQFIGIGYHRAFRLAEGIKVTLLDAGHMLGSAIVVIDIEHDSDTGTARRLVFSGDIGRVERPILRDPEFVTESDVLIMESTYGNRSHPMIGPENGELAAVVNQTVNRGGKVIVPAFAVGRTQELVYRLHELMHENLIPEIKVFIDSPLAINATSIYRIHPEAYDEEMAALMMQGDDPFSAEKMRYTRSVEESKALNFLKEPAVIISASGMAQAGRILHHLKNNIEDPKNTVLIVGWQAPQTLGRRIVDEVDEVFIFGDRYQLNAQVQVMNGFSGHADQNELLDWASRIEQRPVHTFLVHGEFDSASELAKSLKGNGFPEVTVPDIGLSSHV